MSIDSYHCAIGNRAGRACGTPTAHAASNRNRPAGATMDGWIAR
jgi:hypothetical protein